LLLSRSPIRLGLGAAKDFIRMIRPIRAKMVANIIRRPRDNRSGALISLSILCCLLAVIELVSRY